MAEFKYEIVKDFGILEESNGWVKKLTLISWNGGEPKYDIRSWAADGSKMGKGATLSKSELLGLKSLLNNTEF